MLLNEKVINHPIVKDVLLLSSILPIISENLSLSFLSPHMVLLYISLLLLRALGPIHFYMYSTINCSQLWAI